MTDFEWDPKKAHRNLEKHGVRFKEAERVFDGPRLTVADERRDYGEPRFISVGEGGRSILAVIHTERQGSIRLISARRANRKERERYYGYRAQKEREEAQDAEPETPAN